MGMMRILVFGWASVVGAIAACTTEGPCEQGTFQYACECVAGGQRSGEVVCADDASEAGGLATEICEEDGATCTCECEPIGTECAGDRCKG